MRLLILLLLAGCASESLLDRAMVCRPEGSEECVELRQRADEYWERKQEHEPKCPGTLVGYKDRWGKMQCFSPADFERWRTWNFPGSH
jgi:hypothetical protein